MKVLQENIEIFRETSGTITFKPVAGDYSTRLNYVTFKANKTVTGDRLIEKSSTANQVHCVYNSARGESTFSFDYLPADTGDLSETTLVYDIESIDPLDATDKVTPKWGYCKITGDVRNALNGLDLPSTATRFVNIDASEAEVGDIIQCALVGGVKVFTLITLTELKSQLDNL